MRSKGTHRQRRASSQGIRPKTDSTNNRSRRNSLSSLRRNPLHQESARGSYISNEEDLTPHQINQDSHIVESRFSQIGQITKWLLRLCLGTSFPGQLFLVLSLSSLCMNLIETYEFTAVLFSEEGLPTDAYKVEGTGIMHLTVRFVKTVLTPAILLTHSQLFLSPPTWKGFLSKISVILSLTLWLLKCFIIVKLSGWSLRLIAEWNTIPTISPIIAVESIGAQICEILDLFSLPIMNITDLRFDMRWLMDHLHNIMMVVTFEYFMKQILKSEGKERYKTFFTEQHMKCKFEDDLHVQSTIHHLHLIKNVIIIVQLLIVAYLFAFIIDPGAEFSTYWVSGQIKQSTFILLLLNMVQELLEIVVDSFTLFLSLYDSCVVFLRSSEANPHNDRWRWITMRL